LKKKKKVSYNNIIYIVYQKNFTKTMSLTKGNVTVDDALGINPSTIATKSHTQNTGSNRLLVVNTFYINTNTCDTVTYNGTSMTKEGTWTHNDSGAAVKYDVWYLVNPDTGANDVVCDFSVGSGNVAFLATSFTNADQTTPLQSLWTAPANTPHSQNITISTNSMIMGASTSRWTFDGTAALKIDGTSFGFGACDMDTSVSLAQLCVETRNARLTSGSKAVITDTISDSFNADNLRVEIKEYVAPPPSGRRRIIIC
jgi:hypothetical protein